MSPQSPLVAELLVRILVPVNLLLAGGVWQLFLTMKSPTMLKEQATTLTVAATAAAAKRTASIL
jgi:hypothetical protein